MKTGQRVVWTEGMLMTPQHLQQQDLYHEQYVVARFRALSPYGWGVISVHIDQAALLNGELSLQSFSGIFPDGLPVTLEAGTGGAPAARSIEEHFSPRTHSVDVHLCIPREGAETHSARYAIDSRETSNWLNPTSVSSIDFARANLNVRFGDELREDLESIKIAEIVRSGSGALSVQSDYVPPCLRIDASPFLVDSVRSLLRSISGKQRELSSTRRHRDASSLEFTASDVTRYLQLNALNGMVPLLQHLTEAGHLHPELAYTCLIQLAGQLSTFASGGIGTSVPKFYFGDLRSTFGPLVAHVTSLLKTVALEQCVSIPLKVEKGGMHIGNLSDERIGRCSQFVLTVRSDLPEKQTAEQLPRLSKISSEGHIQELIQAAASGVALQPTFRPPPEVPVQPGVVYFSLAVDDPYWKTAIRDGSVAIYLPQPFDPARTQIALLGIPSTSL